MKYFEHLELPAQQNLRGPLHCGPRVHGQVLEQGTWTLLCVNASRAKASTERLIDQGLLWWINTISI